MRYNHTSPKETKEPIIMKDNKIKAVIEDDLVPLLNALGVYGEILAGRERCMYCGSLITLESIEAIVPFNREIRIVCSDLKCRQKLLMGDE